MAFTIGTPQEATGATTTVAVTLSSVSTGDIIAVYVRWNPGGGTITVSSVSDGNAYTQQGSNVTTSASATGAMYAFVNAASGSKTITATFSATTGSYMAAWTVTGSVGMDGTAGQDSNFAGTGTNAVKGASVTTTTNGDLVLGMFDTVSLGGAMSVGTAPATWTTIGITHTNNLGESLVQSSAGAIQAQATTATSGDIIAFTMAMKPIPPPVFLPFSVTQFFVTDQVVQF